MIDVCALRCLLAEARGRQELLVERVSIPDRIAGGELQRFTAKLEEILGHNDTPPGRPEWTNAQCLRFLAVGMRHVEIKGELRMDEIRQGVAAADMESPPGPE